MTCRPFGEAYDGSGQRVAALADKVASNGLSFLDSLERVLSAEVALRAERRRQMLDALPAVKEVNPGAIP